MFDQGARGPAAVALDSAVPEDSNPGIWVEQQCQRLGVSVWRVAREARVDRTTIFRWKSGQRPYWDSFRRVRSVIDSIWDEKRRGDD